MMDVEMIAAVYSENADIFVKFSYCKRLMRYYVTSGQKFSEICKQTVCNAVWQAALVLQLHQHS